MNVFNCAHKMTETSGHTSQNYTKKHCHRKTLSRAYDADDGITIHLEKFCSSKAQLIPHVSAVLLRCYNTITPNSCLNFHYFTSIITNNCIIRIIFLNTKPVLYHIFNKYSGDDQYV